MSGRTRHQYPTNPTAGTAPHAAANSHCWALIASKKKRVFGWLLKGE
jgi:hypothetical protein